MSAERLYPSGSLHGRLAHDIGRRIVSGALAEGVALPREAELAQTNGVSRQAVREALKVLAAKGLIVTRRRAGSVVAPRRAWNLLDPDVLAWHGPGDLSADFLTDLIEFRQMIEPEAAAFAAGRGGPQQIARIKAALQAMHEAPDEPGRFDADVAFHAAIFAASGNSLIDRLSRILGPMLKASFERQGNLAASTEAAVAMHDEIFEGITERDPDRARRAMEAMLDTAGTGISRMLGEGSDPSSAGRRPPGAEPD